MVTAKKYSKKISVEEAQSPDCWDHVAMARGGGAPESACSTQEDQPWGYRLSSHSGVVFT